MTEPSWEYWPTEPEVGPADFLYRGRWIDGHELLGTGYQVQWYDDATRGWTDREIAQGRGIWLSDRIVQLMKQIAHTRTGGGRSHSYEGMLAAFERAYKDVCDNCEHEHFRADVRVGRISDSGDASTLTNFVADVTVSCLDCGQAFGFRGPPGGHSWNEPRCKLDACGISLPLMSPLELKAAGMLPVMERGPMVYEVHPAETPQNESNGQRYLQLRGLEDVADGVYRLDSVAHQGPNSKRVALSLGYMDSAELDAGDS